MASIAELQAQLQEAQLWLNFYAPINNGYGGATYMNQLIFVERLQVQLNRALKEAG